jgi:hypothetical protein
MFFSFPISLGRSKRKTSIFPSRFPDFDPREVKREVNAIYVFFFPISLRGKWEVLRLFPFPIQGKEGKFYVDFLFTTPFLTS